MKAEQDIAKSQLYDISMSELADIWANNFANDLDAIKDFTFRVNYGTV